ncbi:hypothetical protein FE391_15570 [Nonomuraea sp. KC401]|uniref:hypothetical protein n=1 Tax=unclassified Nonomuraea TaxID=2593643 RepID=UPI0010FD6133|nr:MULTISPECIES: hypothetical protein [unclassified Nonomuraea]NBE95159.1 hypothetical protein [Nonomuraea sp. K271]TLF73414.1 hypothetical protein FE391_15570 [Nonomuraea sp. KC401]
MKDSTADVVFAKLAETSGLHLDDAFRRLYFTSKQLHVVWRLTADSTRGGELCLQNITEWAVNGWFPDDWTLSSEKYAQLADLYTIDYEPHAGTGSVAAISVPDARPLSLGTDTPIWYYDAGDHRLEQLDVDYAGYLEAALLTMGAHGRQYLSTDVNLRREVAYSGVAGLEHYLTVLPDIFPGHDYEPLRRRFDARL